MWGTAQQSWGEGQGEQGHGCASLPRLSTWPGTLHKLLHNIFKVEDKEKFILRAVLNQPKRNLPFGFIKRLIKNIEKFSSPFLFFFSQEEFRSSLENCHLGKGTRVTTSCREETQMLQAVWGPAHTRPNSEHKQWPEVGCNYFFSLLNHANFVNFQHKRKTVIFKRP